MTGLLISGGAILAFAAFWTLVCVLISWMSGWRLLAVHFRASSKPTGRNFPMQRAYFNSAQYSGCLSLVIADTGLYASVWPLFPGHAPLLLPWNRVGPIEERKRWFLQSWETRVRLDDGKTVKITFFDATLVREIEQRRVNPDSSLTRSPFVSSTAPPIPDVPLY